MDVIYMETICFRRALQEPSKRHISRALFLQELNNLLMEIATVTCAEDTILSRPLLLDRCEFLEDRGNAHVLLLHFDLRISNVDGFYANLLRWVVSSDTLVSFYRPTRVELLRQM